MQFIPHRKIYESWQDVHILGVNDNRWTQKTATWLNFQKVRRGKSKTRQVHTYFKTCYRIIISIKLPKAWYRLVM